jgi:membrane protein DedA with SNARE-associated domain
MLTRILVGLYLAFGLFALVVAVVDPSDDPLAAVFLVMAAMPWTLLVGWIEDRIGEAPVWVNLVLLSLAVLLNAALLYGLGRWLGSLRRPGARGT